MQAHCVYIIICHLLISIMILSTKNGYVCASESCNAKQVCGSGPLTCPENSRYRSYDGSCNNLKNPTWGTPLSPYGYLVKNNYGDGIYSWPVASDGSSLPNAREISLKIFVPKYALEEKWNLNTQQYGQFIAHDMSFTAGPSATNRSSPVCCNRQGKLVPDATKSPLCHPIDIPDSDTVHKSEGRECLNFVRTISTKDRGSTMPDDPAYPLTSVTPFMDLSLTYGNSEVEAASLREFKGGRLLTDERKGYRWPPQVDNVTSVCGGATSPNETCYKFGDGRANQSPQLTVLQSILLFEHNRVANALAKINPHWNDETLFQEARRICIAEVQYINYYEYLIALLGKENMIKEKLIFPNRLDYVNDYDCNVTPVVFKEHASAALRHFHTLIRGMLDLLTEKRELNYSVRISDWFNKPSLLEMDDAFDELTRGLTYQAADKSDQYWDLEVTKFLFKGNQSTGGDLRATDIQRGRDHGLGTYGQLRAFCKLRVAKTFDDLKVIYQVSFLVFIQLGSEMITTLITYVNITSSFVTVKVTWLYLYKYKNVEILKTLYSSPDDIDLVVGGSLEYHAPGALVGPTFLCILLKQFHVTRISDRYFFENGNDKNIAFTLPQLNAIRKGTSMAKLLCDNSHNIKWMQRNAFELVSVLNPLVPCKELPSVDLLLWAETPKCGNLC